MKTGIDEIPNLLDELKAITAITSISHSIDFIGGKRKRLLH